MLNSISRGLRGAAAVTGIVIAALGGGVFASSKIMPPAPADTPTSTEAMKLLDYGDASASFQTPLAADVFDGVTLIDLPDRAGHPDEDHFARVLHADVEGARATIQMIVGTNQVGEDFAEFAKNMNDQGYNVVTVELPQTGGMASRTVDGIVDLNYAVEAASYLAGSAEMSGLLSNNTGTVILAGHSLGGGVVAAMLDDADAAPILATRYSGVWLDSPMVGVKTSPVNAYLSQAMHAIGSDRVRGLGDLTFGQLSLPSANNLTTDDADPRLLSHRALHAANPKAASAINAGYFLESSDFTANLQLNAADGVASTLPVFMTASLNDPLVPFEAMQSYGQKIGADIRVSQEGKHFVILDSHLRDGLIADVGTFVDSIVPKPVIEWQPIQEAPRVDPLMVEARTAVAAADFLSRTGLSVAPVLVNDRAALELQCDTGRITVRLNEFDPQAAPRCPTI